MRHLTGIVLICTVVAVVVAAGCVPIWAVKKNASATPAPPPATPTSVPLADPAATAPAAPATPMATAPATPAPQAPTLQPGLQAALDTAQAAKPGWAAEVHDHAADWSTAEVKAGPSYGNWQVGLNYKWTFRGYELVSEGAWNPPPPPPTTVIIERQAPPKTVIIKERPAPAQVKPQAPPQGKTVPVSARQGAARATARRQFSGGDSETKILSVSSEWRSVRVQVSTGGQKVGVVSLSWNDSRQAYDINGVDRF